MTRGSVFSVALGLVGFGSGLVVARTFPVALWPLALLLLGVWLGRWPRPQVWLVALVLGGVLASPFGRVRQPEGPELRRYASTAEQTRAWAGMQRLALRNSAGDISVEGGGPPRLRALYRREGPAGNLPAALLTTFAGRELRFTGLEPNWPQTALRGVRAELAAQVPRRVGLEVSGRIGDVMARGLASARVDTNLGDISLSDVAGTVVALTDVGNVLVSKAGAGVEVQTQVGDIWLAPDVSTAPVLARTDVGDIALILPRNANARILATSVSRGLPAEMKRLSPTRGELVLGNGERLIVLETRIGEISVVQR